MTYLSFSPTAWSIAVQLNQAIKTPKCVCLWSYLVQLNIGIMQKIYHEQMLLFVDYQSNTHTT